MNLDGYTITIADKNSIIIEIIDLSEYDLDSAIHQRSLGQEIADAFLFLASQ